LGLALFFSSMQCAFATDQFCKNHYILDLPPGACSSSGLALDFAAPGALDYTFGDGGAALFKSGVQPSTIAFQPDGRIIMAGGWPAAMNWGHGNQFALARLTSSGAIDTTFGDQGNVLTSFGSNGGYATSLAIQPDGKIVAGGVSWTHVDQDYNKSSAVFTLVRYDADGGLDQTFGSGGKVTTPIGATTRL